MEPCAPLIYLTRVGRDGLHAYFEKKMIDEYKFKANDALLPMSDSKKIGAQPDVVFKDKDLFLKYIREPKIRGALMPIGEY
jgi:hypothetical protein